MNNLKLTKKNQKHYSTNEKRRPLAFLAALIVLGTTCVKEDVLAVDKRNREKNIIKIESGNTKLKKSGDKVDVINISTPNEHGISHNKFKDFSVGTGNGVIFNNSTENGISQIGGKVKKNSNLNGTSAKVILNEVTGKTPSNINGEIEVFGNKADFILANENGIMVNNAKFINANGVTLTTGKVSLDGSKVNFDIKNGKVVLNGVENNGDYFNVYANVIEMQKEISLGKNNKDITIITGENTLEANSRNLGEVSIVSSKNTPEKHGVYGTEFGAMHGENIKLISTDLGLGVKHGGLIFSTKDININSNGDITANENSDPIKISNSDIVIKKSTNGVDVVDIKTPNSDGISHNRFTDFSVEAGNGIIFNNSIEDGKSVIGGEVLKNPNLNGASARVILNEVTGKTPSNINGAVEVFGNKADFILANENGIMINNAKFINTNGVSLTTGKVSFNKSKFNFNIKNGEIILDNVESTGDYFNIYSNFIELKQKISAENSNINMIGGENILQGNDKELEKVEVISSEKVPRECHGIYGLELDTMYGKNIRLIGTGEELGVRHAGLIFSTEDMKINSTGILILGDVESQGNLEISGKNVIIEKKSETSKEKGNILSNKDINIEAEYNIINDGIISGNGNIDISGKNIFNREDSSISAERDLILTAKKTIVNKEGSTINAKGKKELNAPEVK